MQLPHPEILAALKLDTTLLVDDGKIRLAVQECSPKYCVVKVIVPGLVSNNKGVNVPQVEIPFSPLTPKDREDLAFALTLGVDYVALSFVQKPADMIELRGLVGNKARILAKIEKPSALKVLDEIVKQSDAIMVARGDLGVELPVNEVPIWQKKIVRASRTAGKPVIVATQMLESMIHSPTPTRAEVSDVATAIYDGADAVMLSAESASGEFPLEAVKMMNAVAENVEHDPLWIQMMQSQHPDHEHRVADAITASAKEISNNLKVNCIVVYTSTGSSALRMSRERVATPIVCVVTDPQLARQMTMVWGVHAVLAEHDVKHFDEMIATSMTVVKREKFAIPGNTALIIAGVPFGVAGSTNMVYVANVT